MVAYVPLFLTWLLFGILHSLTAANSFKLRVLNRWKPLALYYRLLYNGFALLTFLPVWLAYQEAPRQYVTSWRGSEVGGWAVLVTGLAVGLVALRGYDLAEFTGWPVRPMNAEYGVLRQQGLLRLIRHPLYSAILLVLAGLFLREPAWANLLFGGFAFLYIRIGIYFEERKLIAVFGDQYRQYKGRVPMLVPFINPRAK
jgi:protein-S-isoprenylcysteine O-methyltransferase Ste14